MAFEKGHKPLYVRKRGTPNKITQQVREALAMHIEQRWDDFWHSFDAIEDPKDKCQIMVGLLPYVAPKLQSIEYKDKSASKTLADELDEISGEKTRE